MDFVSRQHVCLLHGKALQMGEQPMVGREVYTEQHTFLFKKPFYPTGRITKRGVLEQAFNLLHKTDRLIAANKEV